MQQRQKQAQYSHNFKSFLEDLFQDIRQIEERNKQNFINNHEMSVLEEENSQQKEVNKEKKSLRKMKLQFSIFRKIKRYLVIKSLKNYQMSSQIDISYKTVQRRAKQKGTKAYLPIEKFLMDKTKAEIRLNFAKKMKQQLKKNQYLLHSIIFTDETKFRLYSNDVAGNLYIKCTKEERYDPENVCGKVKFGGNGINAWGCISYNSVGRLFIFEDNLTSKFYAEQILRKELKQSLRLMLQGLLRTLILNIVQDVKSQSKRLKNRDIIQCRTILPLVLTQIHWNKYRDWQNLQSIQENQKQKKNQNSMHNKNGKSLKIIKRIYQKSN